MLDFKTPEISDKDWIDPIVKASGSMGCDAAFGTVYIWRLRYNYKVCRYKDFLIKECLLDDGTPSYTYPIGSGDVKQAVDEIINDAGEKNRKLIFTALTEDAKLQLEQLYPDRFLFEDIRDNADYIYLSEKLINLAGRPYHGKRNHITAFKNSYNWSYERINRENISEALKVCRQWCAENGCNKDKPGGAPLGSEFCAINETFKNYEKLNFVGAILKVDDAPIAMTVGEEITEDVFVTHFEKALPEYRGAYPTINKLFAENELSSYKYINREEDMGIEGLRKAKLSYHPEILLKKYNGVIADG